MNRLDELALIARCALSDDRQAFGQLVEAYQPRVRRFLLNVTLGNEALTDDLAQETFLKAYLGVRSFRGAASFSTWLYRIAYHEFCSHTRKQREWTLPDSAQVDEDDPQPILPEVPDTSMESALDAQMTVRVALAQLSEAERTVVTLFYLQDLPLKKICSITGLPEGTVKSHLHRAKSRLRTLIGD